MSCNTTKQQLIRGFKTIFNTSHSLATTLHSLKERPEDGRMYCLSIHFKKKSENNKALGGDALFAIMEFFLIPFLMIGQKDDL